MPTFLIKLFLFLFLTIKYFFRFFFNIIVLLRLWRKCLNIKRAWARHVLVKQTIKSILSNVVILVGRHHIRIYLFSISRFCKSSAGHFWLGLISEVERVLSFRDSRTRSREQKIRSSFLLFNSNNWIVAIINITVNLFVCEPCIISISPLMLVG